MSFLKSSAFSIFLSVFYPWNISVTLILLWFNNSECQKVASVFFSVIILIEIILR